MPISRSIPPNKRAHVHPIVDVQRDTLHLFTNTHMHAHQFPLFCDFQLNKERNEDADASEQNKSNCGYTGTTHANKPLRSFGQHIFTKSFGWDVEIHWQSKCASRLDCVRMFFVFFVCTFFRSISWMEICNNRWKCLLGLCCVDTACMGSMENRWNSCFYFHRFAFTLSINRFHPFFYQSYCRIPCTQHNNNNNNSTYKFFLNIYQTIWIVQFIESFFYIHYILCDS